MTSSIKPLIENATSPTLTAEKWDIYFTICDYINKSPEQAKEVAKALKKRLNSCVDQSSVSTWYCLLLIETCVKNSTYNFHVHVSNREFLQELQRVISSKHKPSEEIYNKVISMIQQWYEMFQNHSQLSDVARFRAELISKGHEFPRDKVQENIYADLDGTPKDNYSFEDPISPPEPHSYRPQSGATGYNPPPSLSTRSSSVSGPSTAALYGPEQPRRGSTGLSNPGMAMSYNTVPHVANSQFQTAYYNGVPVSDQRSCVSTGPVVPSEVQVCKLNSELELVSGNIRIMCDLISEMDGKTASSEEMQFLEELNRACREMQRRIVDLLTKVDHEALMQHMLLINDDLNNVFLRYDRLIRHQGISTGRIPSAKDRSRNPPTSIHSHDESEDHIYSECEPKSHTENQHTLPYRIGSAMNRPPLPPIPSEGVTEKNPQASNEVLLIDFEGNSNGDKLPSYDAAVSGGMASSGVTGNPPDEEYEGFDDLARSRVQGSDMSQGEAETIENWLTQQEEEYVLPSQVPSEVAKNDFDIFLSDQLKKMRAEQTGGESRAQHS